MFGSRFGSHMMRLTLAALVMALLAIPFAGTTRAADVTLTYGWWSNGPTADAAHRAWLDSFEKANPGIKIQSEILPWDAYWDKVRTTTAGGTAYDIVGLSSAFAALYMDNGVFLDLTKFSDYKTTADALDPNATSIFTWNGAQYVLPVGLAARTLGYRKDLFDAAGLKYPDATTPLTIDDLVQMAKKLTVTKDGQVSQYLWHPTGSEPWYAFIANEGGQMYDSFVNPTHVTINTPQGIQGLKDVKRLVDEKVLTPLAEANGGQWGDGGLASLRTNKVVMADLGPWNFADIVKDNLPIGNTVYPVAKAGQDSLLFSGANGYAINKNTKNADAAWTFLKWMSSTPAELAYAQWSDFPANVEAQGQVAPTLKPAELTPAMLAQLKGFRPSLLTTKPELGSTMFQIMRDMTEGKITPEDAAAQMEQQGNDILGYVATPSASK